VYFSRSYLLVLVAAISFAYESGYSQWVQTNGPQTALTSTRAATSINALGTDLYIGTTNDSLYRSTDQGVSWQVLASPWRSELRTLLVLDTNIYATTIADGIFRGSLNGTNWKSASVNLPGSDMRALITANGALYLGLTGGRIYVSTNHGNSWTLANKGIPNSSVTGLATIGTKLMAVTEFGGAYISNDAGQTWTIIASFPNIGASSLTAIGSTVYATTTSGLVSSTDLGVTWQSANTGLGSNRVMQLAAAGNFLLAATETGGAFASTNNGGSWTAINIGLSTANLTSIIAVGNSVYVLTADHHLYVADPSVLTWSPITTDLPYGLYDRTRSLLLTDFGLLAGTQTHGVFLSTDDGQSWAPRNNGMKPSAILAMAQLGNTVFADFYLSTDQGRNWQWAPPKLQSQSGDTLEHFTLQADSTVHAFAVQNENVFAAVMLSNTYGGLYETADHGNTWSHPLPGYIGTAVAVHGSEIFAATSTSFTPGINRSSDGGNTWSDASTGIPKQSYDYISSIAWVGSTGFMSTPRNGIYYTSNNGASWLAITSGSTPNEVFCLLAVGNALLAGTRQGVYVSEDVGMTWRPANTGLTQTIFTLTRSGSNLYAGSWDGVWRRPIAEVAPSASVARGTSDRTALVFPNPFTHSTGIKLPTSTDAQIRILNVLGQEVLNTTLEGSIFTWDANALPAGCYTVIVIDGTGTHIEHAIKEGR
jgi:photosystem II stability/assembly factor-like uncharacterized protein